MRIASEMFPGRRSHRSRFWPKPESRLKGETPQLEYLRAAFSFANSQSCGRIIVVRLCQQIQRSIAVEKNTDEYVYVRLACIDQQSVFCRVLLPFLSLPVAIGRDDESALHRLVARTKNGIKINARFIPSNHESICNPARAPRGARGI